MTNSPSSNAESGVSSASLRTIVHPVASAGAIFQTAISEESSTDDPCHHAHRLAPRVA